MGEGSIHISFGAALAIVGVLISLCPSLIWIGRNAHRIDEHDRQFEDAEKRFAEHQMRLNEGDRKFDTLVEGLHKGNVRMIEELSQLRLELSREIRSHLEHCPAVKRGEGPGQ